MANSLPLPPPGFDDLSIDEQIEYVQSLWDRIAATPEQVPVPQWHREILDERIKEYDANPDAGESWDVVRERMRDKLPRRWSSRWHASGLSGRWRSLILPMPSAGTSDSNPGWVLDSSTPSMTSLSAYAKRRYSFRQFPLVFDGRSSTRFRTPCTFVTRST